MSDGLAVCVISLRHLFASWRILKWTNELFDQIFCVPEVIIRTRFNIQQFHVLPSQCIYVFCVDMRTNSEYFPIQH
jgi:hypothetical protein